MINSIKTMYNQQIEQLKRNNIKYKEYSHEPILDFKTAKKVKNSLKWKGTESKNLLLKSKDNQFYLLYTIESKRADISKLKEITGKRLSFATDQEVKKITGCIPGSVVPFPINESIIILFDKEVLNHKKIIYSPVDPVKSIEINTKDINIILNSLNNKLIQF